MRAVARISLANRAFIALAAVAVVIVGVFSMTSLRQELIPQVELPQISVVATLPGASAEQVGERIAEPIERSLQTLEDVERTTTTSSSSLALVTVELVYGTDTARSANQVDVRLNALADSFPEGTTTQVISGGTGEIPAAVVSISADLEPSDLAERIESIVQPEVENITGVANAQVIGGPERIIQVIPDEQALDDAGLTEDDLIDVLGSIGVVLPSTPLTQDGVRYDVTVGAEVADLDDLRSVPVLSGQPAAPTQPDPAQPDPAQPDPTQPGQPDPGQPDPTQPGQPDPTQPDPAQPEPVEPPEPVDLGEVAEVELADRDAESVSRTNGQPSLTLLITPTATGNFVDISTGVQDSLDETVGQIGGAADYVVVFDQAPFITDSISALAQEGALGLAMAVAVILLFLLAIRPTVVTAISIPLSLLMTFVGLLLAGYTLNILTLAAITLSVGRVVDDSIVVIENINRHLRHPGDRRRRILDAVGEVAGAITASTLVTVIVFLPLAVVSGVAGELFRPFALTVAIAMFASLIVALTIVPVLAYWFLKVPQVSPAEEQSRDEVAAGAQAPGADPVGSERDDAEDDPTGSASGDARPARPSRWQQVRWGLARRIAPSRTRTARTPERSDPPTQPAPSSAKAAAPAMTEAVGDRSEADPVSSYPLAETDSDRNWLTRIYRPVLRGTQARPVLTLVAAVLIFAGSIAMTPLLSVNFLSGTGQNLALLTQTLAPGTNLSDATDRASESEQAILADPDVEVVQTTIGGGGFGFGGSSNEIQYAITTDPAADQEELAERLRTTIAELPDAGEVAAADFGGIGSSTADILITGPTAQDRADAAEAILDAVQDLPDAAAATSDLQADTPTIQITVDRQEAADRGLTEEDVVGLIALTIGERAVNNLTLEGRELQVFLTSEEAVETLDDLRDVEILGEPITDIATIDEVLAVPEVTTVNTQETVTVSVTPADSDDVGALSGQITDALGGLDLPDGTVAQQAGATADIDEAFEQLGLALIAAVLLVYLLLVWLLKSLAQPLILLVSIPFAATGAIGLMLATGTPLGVPTLIGVLMLVGIVVTNSIVLMDLINQYRRRGLPLPDAVRLGSLRRLRPIVMTAAATIGALVPLALGVTGHSGFISAPLAIVTIGGLFSSTLLTLVLVPVLYLLVEGGKERRADKRAERADRAENATAVA